MELNDFQAVFVDRYAMDSISIDDFVSTTLTLNLAAGYLPALALQALRDYYNAEEPKSNIYNVEFSPQTLETVKGAMAAMLKHLAMLATMLNLDLDTIASIALLLANTTIVKQKEDN